jgi:hypothetical protein
VSGPQALAGSSHLSSLKRVLFCTGEARRRGVADGKTKARPSSLEVDGGGGGGRRGLAEPQPKEVNLIDCGMRQRAKTGKRLDGMPDAF